MISLIKALNEFEGGRPNKLFADGLAVMRAKGIRFELVVEDKHKSCRYDRKDSAILINRENAKAVLLRKNNLSHEVPALAIVAGSFVNLLMLEKGLAPFGIQNRTPSAASEAKVRALIVELTIANVIAYSDKNEWSRVHQTPADGFKYEYGALKASNNIVKQLASHYDASEDELIATLNLANELGLINKRENLVAF